MISFPPTEFVAAGIPDKAYVGCYGGWSLVSIGMHLQQDSHSSLFPHTLHSAKAGSQHRLPYKIQKLPVMM
jgi:hypothetical protein